MTCSHAHLIDGPRIPLRWGSAASDVCKDCGVFRHRPPPDMRYPEHSWLYRWRPADELVEATAEDDEV